MSFIISKSKPGYQQDYSKFDNNFNDLYNSFIEASSKIKSYLDNKSEYKGFIKLSCDKSKDTIKFSYNKTNLKLDSSGFLKEFLFKNSIKLDTLYYLPN